MRRPRRGRAELRVLGGTAGSARSADVAAADVVVCCDHVPRPRCSTAAWCGRGTVVVAVGSHEPDAREVDDALVGAPTVVVEARSAALREAGDVVAAVAAACSTRTTVVDLADVVRGAAAGRSGAPGCSRASGMAWEDLVIAASTWEQAVMTVDGLALPALGARRNLREEITQTLRAAVIAGELRPGVVYSAPSLATQFGVSRDPGAGGHARPRRRGPRGHRAQQGFPGHRAVREGPRRPERAARADRGAHRRAGSPRPACPRRCSTELRPLAAEIEDAAARGDLIAHVAADMEFHLRLLALAGNPHLVETVRSLRARSRIYGLRTLADRDALVPSAHEHAELLDLLAAGDADGAERLMRRHIAPRARYLGVHHELAHHLIAPRGSISGRRSPGRAPTAGRRRRRRGGLGRRRSCGR